MTRTSLRTSARSAATTVALAMVLALLDVPPVLAAPTGFTIETMPFAGLVEPSTVEFGANGQVFVAERRGVIKVYDNLDDTSSRTTADLRERVYNNGDRGLLGMALDPQYPIRPYLWMLYAKDADPGQNAPKYGTATSDTDPCPVDGGANDCRVTGELSRLTLNPADGTWTNQETVLLTGWCQQFGSHSIGTIVFGQDGYLYLSSGDGASYNQVDTGNLGNQKCDDPTGEGGALRAQSVRRPAGEPAVLNGAILRIDPHTGAAAPGNPFITDTNDVKQRVIGYGLRNPFRITTRPGTNEVWVADVGWNAWEELDRIDVDTTAENFGWPCYEGMGRQSGYDDANASLCESLYAAGVSAAVTPQFTYNHGSQVGTGCPTGSSAISAVAFAVNATAYPQSYRDGVFFGDYSRHCLWFASMSGSNINTSSIAMFDSTTYPADLKPGPNGDLYVVDIVSQQIKRIRYSANGNTPPIAIAKANPSAGPLPLNVQFDGGGSSDPDAGSSITYAWDLDGDGDFDDSTALAPTWTYTASGAVTVKLRVTDNTGASTVTSVVVTPGSNPPAIALTSSATANPWKVGDTVTFSVSATDPEDGPLPASAVSTKLVIKHCPGGANCHDHVQQTFPGAGGSFVAPDHEYPSYLELQSSATDSSGITATSTLRLDPATVNLTIDTVPTGLQATVGGDARTTPFTVPVIQGSVNTIAVSSPQVSGSTYEFTSWSDGGAISHNVTANATGNYTATFTATGGPPAIPGLVGAWTFNEGSGTTAGDSSGRGNTGVLNGPVWTTAGRYGGALTFDGVNDWVSVNDSASLDLTTAGSLTAWVRPSTLGAWRQAVLKETPTGLAYSLYATGGSGNRPNGTLSIGGADREVNAPGALGANAWSHLALTYDGTTMRLYVNGTPVATQAQSGAMATSNNPLRIGGNSVWGEYFAGQIDEAHVYNRALTAAEVVADSNSTGTSDTIPPTVPGGVAAIGGIGSVNLTWTASTDNATTPTYEVHRSLVDGFSPIAATRIASGVTGISYTDTSLPTGTYYYRVIASDGTNLSAPSGQASATVTGDVTAPSVPTGASVTVTGTTATARWAASTDDVGVTEYQVRRTGPGQLDITTFSVTAPTLTLSNTGLAAGTYAYEIRARDAAGNSSAFSAPPASVTVVTDQSPPTVGITAPADGSSVSGTVALSANAADDIGVAGVQFRVDGSNVGTEDTTAPYGVSWNSATVVNGSHQVTAVARDTSGKTTTSAPVTVTVANTGISGQVGAWSFNEGIGTTVGDASGQNNTGTLNGPVWTSTGKYGGALTFDGVNDFVNVPDANSLDLTTGMTLSAWVRPTTLGNWRQVLLKERPNGLTYGLYGTGGTGNRPNSTISVGGVDREVNAPAASALTVNTWAHLAVTYDGTTMRIYVNGTQVATRAQTGAMATSSNALKIGGNAIWGEWYAGQVDEVRVFNRALTAVEITFIRDTPL